MAEEDVSEEGSAEMMDFESGVVFVAPPANVLIRRDDEMIEMNAALERTRATAREWEACARHEHQQNAALLLAREDVWRSLQTATAELRLMLLAVEASNREIQRLQSALAASERAQRRPAAGLHASEVLGTPDRYTALAAQARPAQHKLPPPCGGRRSN